MEVELSGPWDADRVRAHLDRSRIPVRLACLRGDGFPMVVSLWYLHRDGALWCATQDDALVTRRLRADPRCGFEVAGEKPPYRGVRGWGRAELRPAEGPGVLRALVGRYLGDGDSELARWLLSRAESEVALRIAPLRLVTWDYSDRMESA